MSVTELVQDKYAAIATSSLSGAHAGVSDVARAFGYTPEELAAIPEEANMGLSCGNPTAMANLRPGEVVVDLGCGGGMDVFLASQKVGPTGKAIGIDMTPQMIERAKAAAKRGLRGKPFTNVEFYPSKIDKLPLADASADVVISNCVINLAPDKNAVLREIVRVLKPGGRVAISDIALKQPLPPEIANDLMAYVGCVAGAVLIEDYRRGLIEAGFADVQVLDSNADLSAYSKVEGQTACCSPAAASPSKLPVLESGGCCSTTNAHAEYNVHEGLGNLLRRFDINAFAASVKIFAVKPDRGASDL